MASSQLVRTLALVALGVSLSAAPAAAQTPEDRATARMLVQEADKRLADRDYLGAIDLFTRAFALVPAPTIQLARGRAKALSGKLVEAQSDLLDAAHSRPVTNEPAAWSAARETAAREADAVGPRLAALEISVDGASPGAVVRVLVDGNELSPALLGVPRAVNPGAHVVSAEAGGFVHTEERPALVEGERRRVSLHLTREAAPRPAVEPVVPAAAPALPAAPPAVASPPPSAGTSTPAPPPPTASSGDASNASPAATGHGTTLSTLGYAGAALFGAVWIATGVASMVQVSHIKDRCTGNECPRSLESEASTARTLGTVATICVPLSLGSLALGIFAPRGGAPATARDSASLELRLGPTSAQLRGAF